MPLGRTSWWWLPLALALLLAPAAMAAEGPPPRPGAALAELRDLAQASADRARDDGEERPLLDTTRPPAAWGNQAILAARGILAQLAAPWAGEEAGPTPEGLARRLRQDLSRMPWGPGRRLWEDLLVLAPDLGLSPDDAAAELLREALGLGPADPDEPGPFLGRLLEAHLRRYALGGAPPAGLRIIPFVGDGWSQICRVLLEMGYMSPGDAALIQRPLWAPGWDPQALGPVEAWPLALTPGPGGGWEVDQKDLSRVGDRHVRLWLLAHPGQPASRAMDDDFLTRAVSLVKGASPELMILDRMSPAPGQRPGRTWPGVLPRNTVGIYHLGPWWGLPAGSPGVLLVPRRSMVEYRLNRYSKEPGGYAGPRLHQALAGLPPLLPEQRNLLRLAAAFSLSQAGREREAAAADRLGLARRELYAGLGVPLPPGPPEIQALVDLGEAAKARWGGDLADWLAKAGPLPIARAVARDQAVVVGPDAAAGRSLLWVGLAGLDPAQARRVGLALRQALDVAADRLRQARWGRDLGWWASVDQQLFLNVNYGWESPFWDVVMPWVSKLVPLLPLILIALWLLFSQGRRGRYIVVGLALSFVLTDWVNSEFLRPWLGRPRPYTVLEGIRWFDGGQWQVTTSAALASFSQSFGMPSAHASNTFGPAVFLLFFHPRLGLGLYGLGLLVGLSRIYLGLHYPFDVVGGALWGGLCGALMGWLTLQAWRARVTQLAAAPERPPGPGGRR